MSSLKELNYHGGTAIYHGDVYINRFGSGTITFGYAGAHDFYGNLYFNGTQATSDGNNNHFNFKGNTNQSIASTNTHQLGFLRLGVNKPGGALSIDAKVNVLVNLTLTKVNIQVQPTANFGLSTSATVSGGSDSSYVEGFMSKQGTAAFTFPLGGNGSYAPLGIDAVASSCTFKAQYIAEDPDSLYPRSQKDTTLGFINRCGYWNLDRTAGTQNTRVTLGWSNNPCFAPNPADAKVAKWDGYNWLDYGISFHNGMAEVGNVKSELMLSNSSSIMNLSARCEVNSSYISQIDSSFLMAQVVKLMPSNQKNYTFKHHLDIIKSGIDSFLLIPNSSAGSIISAIITENNGCEHKFSIPTLNTPFRESSCGVSNEIGRQACECGEIEINDPNYVFPLNSDKYYRKNFYRRLPTDNNSQVNNGFVPMKRIGINVIVIQQSPNAATNFIDIPQHRFAISQAFDGDPLRSVRAFFLNKNSNPSDPFLNPNAELLGAGFEFYLKNIYFLPVSANLYSTNLLNRNNQLSIYNYAHSIYGCEMDNVFNYFLMGEQPQGFAEVLPGTATGIATMPSCVRADPLIAFTEKTYSNYLINGQAGFVWALTRHLDHEFGHLLGLNHTYNSCQQEDDNTDFDGFTDLYFNTNGNDLTCPHGGYNPIPPPCVVPIGQDNPNVFINDPSDPCYNEFTNNVVGGDWRDHLYYSPDQVAKMHKSASVTNLMNYVEGSPYSAIPIRIRKNEEWELEFRVYNDIIIETGKTLTLRCSLYMPTQARIIIEPGARLIMEPNSYISCGDRNNMWAGIRVQGISTQPQGTINNTPQGVLIMQPGSTIENAEEGIFTSNINGEIYNSAGGIVQADGAIFRNNYRSAAFHVYNFPSISFFRNCQFIRDAHLRNPAYQNPDGSWQGSKHFVTIWAHRGIEFTDNTFESTLSYDITSNCSSSSYSWGDNERGTGIGTFDAQFDLISTNPSAGQRNRFINLTRGIEARVTNSSVGFNFSTDGSEFTNVKYAIFTEHGNNDIIKNNDFASLNPDGSGGPETPNSYALYLHNYRFADVQFNLFSGTQNPQPEEWGIVAQQLNSNASATITRNDFTKLNRAFQAQRNNTALEIKCNEFFNNQLDWHVNPLTLGNFANQGVGCGPNDYRPGNLFLDANQNHIFSQQVIGGQNGSGPAWYYYCRLSNNIEIPSFQNATFAGTANVCTDLVSQLPTPCPNGTGARLSNDLQAIRLGLESEIEFLENNVTQLQDSLDHQQTNALLALIADTSARVGAVFATLYNHSLLSDTVLISFLERDSITNAQLISLFSLNLPGSGRLLDSLSSYAINHSVDTTTLDSLQKLQAYNPNTESITQIKRNIEFYRAEWKRVVAKTERAYIEENKLEELIGFYKDSLGAGYEKETFGAYLASGNITTARNWLQNNLPQNNANDSAFVSYHNLYLDLMEDSISWLQLNSSQLARVHSLAGEESEIQHLALNVLALRGDTVLKELPEFSNTPAARLSGKSNSPKTNNQIANNNLNVYPNPSNGLFVVRLTNEMDGLSLNVVDVTGRNVFQFDYRGLLQEKSINLSHLSNGVYYVNCSSNGQYIGSAPIVIYR